MESYLYRDGEVVVRTELEPFCALWSYLATYNG